METQLPLSHLLLDSAMYRWLKANADEQAKCLKMKRLPLSHDTAVGELSTQRVLTCKAGGPIRVTAFRDSGRYEIIDGRHRTVLAIREGDAHIDAVIETDEESSRIDNMFV